MFFSSSNWKKGLVRRNDEFGMVAKMAAGIIKSNSLGWASFLVTFPLLLLLPPPLIALHLNLYRNNVTLPRRVYVYVLSYDRRPSPPPPPRPLPHSRFEKKCWKGEARRIRGLALPAKRRILSNTTPRGVMRIVGETTTNGESCFERDKLCCAISWGNINEMYLRNFATGWELIKEFLKYISKCIFARWNILYKRERRRKERKRGGGMSCQVLLISARKSCGGGVSI